MGKNRRYSDSAILKSDSSINALKIHSCASDTPLTSTNFLSTSVGDSIDVHQEIQLLTTSLFEEANRLVAEEAKKKCHLQLEYDALSTDFKESQNTIMSLRVELSFLKNEYSLEKNAPLPVLNGTLSSSTAEKSLVKIGDKFLTSVISDFSLSSFSTSYLYEKLFSFLRIDKNLNDLFNKQLPRASLILKNPLFAEIEPLLSFINSELRPKQILGRIIENNIFLEKIRGHAPGNICALCANKDCLQFHSYFDLEKTFSHIICHICREQIFVVCELLTWFRLIHMKILKLASDLDKKVIYLRFCYLKRNMFYLLSNSSEFFQKIDSSMPTL